MFNLDHFLGEVTFSLDRIIADEKNWVDEVYFQDKKIGFFGCDSEGMFLNLESQLSSKELSLLVNIINEKYSLEVHQKIEINVCMY